MAYNYGFPATYQPMYQPVTQPNSVQGQQNGIIWVQGEAGAKSYLVAPNNTIQLWDSESQTIYLKSADASGMPSMKILDYTVRETNRNAPISAVANPSDKNITYATKDEINGLNDEIQALRSRMDKLTKKLKEDEDE